MQKKLLSKASGYLARARYHRIWTKVVTGLACVVVFCTTYALILPAITLETDATYCGYQEHTHTEACYSRELICGKEESEGHTHGEGCYQTTTTLICDLEESEEHTHTDACYKTEEILICEQEESEGHTHTDACYEEKLICGKEEHTHTDACRQNPDADAEAADDADADSAADTNGADNVSAVETSAEETFPAQEFTGEEKNVGVKVTATAPEGAFPEGTEMTVSEADEEAVQAAADAVNADAADVQAVDITFTADGKEIEPAMPISVKLESALVADTENTVVVHVDDEAKAEIVEETTVEGEAVTFEVDAFSVYAIVPTDERYIFEFYVATDDGKGGVVDVLQATQTVRAGDLLTRPEIPDVPEIYNEFVGWVIGGTQNQETQVWSGGDMVTFGPTTSSSLAAALTAYHGAAEYDPENDAPNVIKAHARFSNIVVVTFVVTGQDDDGEEIEYTVAERETTNGYVTISDLTAEPPSSDLAFAGWSTTKNSTTTINESQYRTNENTTLYAVFSEAHTLTFVNGEGATSTTSQHVKQGANTIEPSLKPQRQGYTFDGWYTGTVDAEGNVTYGEKFVFGNALSSDTTIYAKWEPAAANYTVIIWKQKLDNDYNYTDAQKTYDFESSSVITSTTGATVAVSTTDINKTYEGFHLGRYDSSKTVAGDGSTVLNVYYDRNINYIIFNRNGQNAQDLSDSGAVTIDYYYTEATTTNTTTTYYGLVNGQYVQLTRGEGTTTYYLSTSNNGAEYTGTVYTRSGNNNYNYVYSAATPPYTYSTTYYYTTNSRNYYALTWVSNTIYTWKVAETGEIYTGTRYTQTATTATGNRTNNQAFIGLYGQNFSKYGYVWPANYSWNEQSNGNGTGQTFLYSFSQTDTVYTLYNQGNNTNTYTVHHMIETVGSNDPKNAANYTEAGTGKIPSNGHFTLSNKFTGFTVYGYNSSTSGSITTGQSSVTNVQNLYIYHQRNSYKIYFFNGPGDIGENGEVIEGSNLFATVTKEYEADLDDSIFPDTSTLTYYGNAQDASHYSFAGWYSDVDCTVPFEIEEGDTMPANNIALYAKWVPDTVTVTYDPAGGHFWGTGDEIYQPRTDTIDYNSKAYLYNLSGTMENYEFLGWVYNENGEEKYWNFNDAVTDNLELTAKWHSTEAVTFTYMVLENEEWVEKELDLNQYLDSAPVIVMPYETDDAFAGWRLGSPDTSASFSATTGTFYGPGDTITVSAVNDLADGKVDDVITLYAVYDVPNMTTLVFKPNDGAFANGVEGVENNGDYVISLPNNEGVDLDTIPTPIRDGYKLLGWSTDENATVPTFWADDTPAKEIAVSTDISQGDNILYAVWEKMINLTVKKVDTATPTTTLPGAEFTLSHTVTDEEEGTSTTYYYSDDDGWVELGENNTLSDYALTTDENGTCTFSDLERGETYTLTEVKAPNGYNLLADTITITVNANGDITAAYSNGSSGQVPVDGTTVTVTNSAGQTLPNTGGEGTYFYTYGGLLMMAGAVMCGYTLRRKRERRTND